MADDVKIPGAKKPLPKWAVFGGVGVVGLLIYQHYRSSSSSSQAAAQQAASQAASSTDQYPPDGTTGNPSDPYSTDPATGQTYGNESSGSGGTYGAYGGNGSSYDGIVGYDSSGNPIYAPGYGPGSSGTGTGGPPFSDNPSWSNWVIQQMQANNPAVNVGALTDALGLYLDGQPVDAAQKQLVLDAEAIGGPPPVAGANGYPPKVQTASSGGSSGGGGTGGGGSGHTVGNLHVIGRGRNYLNLGWSRIAGVGKYEVRVYEGSHEVRSATVGTNKDRVSGLKPNTRYHVFVRANNGPAGSGIYATTLK